MLMERPIVRYREERYYIRHCLTCKREFELDYYESEQVVCDHCSEENDVSEHLSKGN